MLKLVGGFIGWRFIPTTLADYLLPYFHNVYSAITGLQPPPKNSSLYHRHRRYMYTLVVFGYSIYCFYGAATAIGPNYYEVLGVGPAADESELKAGFRTFARKYHPDKAGPQSEALFMEVRDAYEALKDPVTRFAYDRCAAVQQLSVSSRSSNTSSVSTVDLARKL